MRIKSQNKSRSNGDGHKLSVMLVDVDLAELRVMRRLLHQKYGESLDIVGIAGSGEECLSLAQAFAPKVVVMDLDMPGLSGLGAIPLLHIIFPETRVIALTFDGKDESRQAVLAAGGSDLIRKSDLETYLIPAIEWAMEQDCTDSLMLPVTV